MALPVLDVTAFGAKGNGAYFVNDSDHPGEDTSITFHQPTCTSDYTIIDCIRTEVGHL
jgi:hypothetical protein